MNQEPKTLPVLKIELPPVPQEPERWCLTVVDVTDPGRHHLATAEEAQKFLELAGYRVIDPPGVEQLRDFIEATREPEPGGHPQLDCDLFAAHIRRVSDAGRRIADYLYIVLGKP